MKVENAVLKSEYSRCLIDFINLKIPSVNREASYKRMQEIEAELKNQDPSKTIHITISTEPLEGSAPSMFGEAIEKEKQIAK